jgi:hypothetical protein
VTDASSAAADAATPLGATPADTHMPFAAVAAPPVTAAPPLFAAPVVRAPMAAILRADAPVTALSVAPASVVAASVVAAPLAFFTPMASASSVTVTI